MKVVCAWCGTVLRDGAPDMISHGVCGPCADAVEAEAVETLRTAARRAGVRRRVVATATLRGRVPACQLGLERTINERR